jgi:general stress protein YciG
MPREGKRMIRLPSAAMHRPGQKGECTMAQEPKKGQMTVEEAGRKGGETVRDERGSEFYSEIGHKGGQRVRELIEEGKQAEEEQGGSKK